ncbi:Serine-threonine/tyrosine-protein kinase [Theobroma cacao]|nr:Serine-threonine/tyrosine-protein kinase [Theobroma cacao]
MGCAMHKWSHAQEGRGTVNFVRDRVLDGKPYNRRCDVYSFGICLWEIYCCDMPYPDLSFADVSSAVVRQNLRPEIPRCCPSSLASIMRKCWDANPEKRPEMDEVSLDKDPLSHCPWVHPTPPKQGGSEFQFSNGNDRLCLKGWIAVPGHNHELGLG